MFVANMCFSTDGDRPALDALLTASVDDRHLFEDRVGENRGIRAGLASALEFLRAGDCLVVWKLGRLGLIATARAQHGHRP